MVGLLLYVGRLDDGLRCGYVRVHLRAVAGADAAADTGADITDVESNNIADGTANTLADTLANSCPERVGADAYACADCAADECAVS